MRNRSSVISPTPFDGESHGGERRVMEVDIEGRSSPESSLSSLICPSPPASPPQQNMASSSSSCNSVASSSSAFDARRVTAHVTTRVATKINVQHALLFTVALGASISMLLAFSHFSPSSSSSAETITPKSRLTLANYDGETEALRQPRSWNRDDMLSKRAWSNRAEREMQRAKFMAERKPYEEHGHLDGKGQMTNGGKDEISALVAAAESAAKAAGAAAAAAQAALRTSEKIEEQTKKNNAMSSFAPTSNIKLDTAPLAPDIKENDPSEKVLDTLFPPLAASPETFALAYKQSFGFFNDITNESWKRMRQHFLHIRTHWNHDNPSNPMEHSKNPRAWYQVNWEPNFSCAHERRIGGMGDGPKWVCDPHRIPASVSARPPEQKKNSKCLVYSIGSEGNAKFERGIIDTLGEHACEIHTFDLADYTTSMPPNVHFHPWGLQPSGGFVDPGIQIAGGVRTQGNFKSLQQIVKELGHEGRVIDIFKIDCEGCEWTTYEDWFNANVDIRQILVEVHQVPPVANAFFDAMQRNGYVTFHKEPNTFYAAGDCQEYAFLKLDEPFFHPQKW